MFFCERCNSLMPDTKCAICGKKKLREVAGEDFCHFVTLNKNAAEFFEENLKIHNIPVASLGVEGLKTSNRFKIFIQYHNFEQAKEIYEVIFGK